MERSKYNVSNAKAKRTYDGIVFDSVLEMKYYRDVVCPLKESGDIVYCQMQKPYELQPKFLHDDKIVQSVVYVADFYIVYKDGREEVIDTKGYPDQTAKLKRKLFWYKYPLLTYKWVSYSKIDGGWILYDDLKRLRSKRKKEKEGKNNG